MGKERDPVIGRDDGRGCLWHLRGRTKRFVERLENRRAGHAGLAGIVVLRLERGESLARVPVAVRDDGHRFFQADDVLDAWRRLGGCRID